ncbi:MAG: ribulose-phosphate 3-epimerase [Clostridia bacterium]|nr:ribulose-phosphate 3-epimerase [Clostridia bacterium]
MKDKLAPSLMCCDYLHLGDQLAAFEDGGVELLHLDVMDGSFVPNFALGTDYIKQLKAATKLPLDVHLMIREPERHLDLFPVGEGDYVSVHYETATHLQRLLAQIRSKGAKALLAINPGTPIELAADVLDDIDGVLVMTVNPGFAGQKMVPASLRKIQRVRSYLDANGLTEAEIEVDGNVSVENAIRMRAAGANIFVAGTSAVFCGKDIRANVKHFRSAVFGE